MSVPALARLTFGMLASGFLVGCAPKQTEKPATPAGEQHSVAAHVVRGKELQEAQNDLRQLGQFYQAFITEMNRAPKTLHELEDYLRKDMPALATRLEEGRYIVELHAHLTEPTRVLAYEKDPDLNGMQVFVRTDGSVDKLRAAELKALLGKH